MYIWNLYESVSALNAWKTKKAELKCPERTPGVTSDIMVTDLMQCATIQLTHAHVHVAYMSVTHVRVAFRLKATWRLLKQKNAHIYHSRWRRVAIKDHLQIVGLHHTCRLSKSCIIYNNIRWQDLTNKEGQYSSMSALLLRHTGVTQRSNHAQ